MKNLVSGKSILIVDDDTQFARSVSMFIDDIGGEPVLIHDGTRAIEYLRKENADLLLLDLFMPGINGIEIISEMRKKENYLPIIVISGTANLKEAIEAVRKGADDFIAKPIANFEELEIAIHGVFQKVELTEELEEHRKNLELMVKLRTAQLEIRTEALQESNKILNEEIERRVKAENYIKQGSLNVLNALESARKKLAFDLHDSIGQKLMFAKLSIETFIRNKMTDKSNLEKAVDNIDQIGGEIRTIIKSLYPQSIEKYSFCTNLQTLVQDMEKLQSAEYELVISGTDSITDSKIKLNLYRIFQEALNNIHKHASAKKVSIKVDIDASLFKAQIQDDGIGMELADVNSVSFGTGLFSMRERVHELKGIINIASKPGSGTSINLELPL